jgi:hypothetical protein
MHPPALTLLALSSILLAGAVDGSAMPAPESAPASPKQLHWLAGDWCGEYGGARIEEHWRLQGDRLLGYGSTVRDGTLRSFEFTRIEQRDGRTAFVAQPGGEPPTLFWLRPAQGQRADFHNPNHDFPQRLSYWRHGAELHAEIAGPGMAGELRIGYAYRACESD